MAGTIDKPTKKPTTRTRKVVPRKKPVSKPSILNLDKLDKGENSVNSRNKEDSKYVVEKEENQFSSLFTKSPEELMKMATESGVDATKFSRRIDLLISLMSVLAEQSDVLIGAGVLDVLHDGFGFLRNPEGSDKKEDIYVSQTQIRRFSLRKGDFVAGQVRPPKDNEKYYGLIRVEMVNGGGPDSSKNRGRF